MVNDKQAPDILYENSTRESEKQKERNALLNKIGDRLTAAQILYSTRDDIITTAIQDQIGKDYGNIRNNLAKILSGKDTAGMLDLAHGDKMNDRSYIKDAIKLKNFDDPAVGSDKEYLKEKISKQFKDYGFKSNNIKGYFFKKDSEPSKRVAKNKDFHQILKDNKEAILTGKDFSGRFPKHGRWGVLANNNFKNAIGAADFKHPYLDKNGNVHVKMYDTYDFNKEADDRLNKAGAREMEDGNLKPYFSIHDIIISKDKLDKIWE